MTSARLFHRATLKYVDESDGCEQPLRVARMLISVMLPLAWVDGWIGWGGMCECVVVSVGRGGVVVVGGGVVVVRG